MLDTGLLGTRIKDLRKKRGMTQSDFAQMLNVSFQAVSNWERGIAPPDIENLVRIASCFGVLVDDLLCAAGEDLFIGVDGGGTKTEFVVVDRSGRVLGRHVRTGSNPNDIGPEAAAKCIGDGIRDMLVRFPAVRYVYCGIAGTGVGDYGEQLQAALQKRYPSLVTEVHRDIYNIFALASGVDMAIISGTGSVAFVRKGEQMIRLGGWGYLLDDAGSAYDVGRDAVTTALREEDALQEPSQVSRLLRETMGVESVADVIGAFYAKGRGYIATFAGVVFQAYRQGDPTAIAIVERNAARLAELLNLGMRTYDAGNRAVVGGGLFEHYGDILGKHIAKYSDCQLIFSNLPPVYGACIESCRLADGAISEDFEMNFHKTYQGAMKYAENRNA